MTEDTSDTLTVEKVLAISDPGNIDRENQTATDRFIIHFGNIVAWAFPLLMIAIVAQVFLRANGNNQAWLDDLQWWIYGFAMLTAFGYAIVTNSHVRVDILHQNYSPERKARIEAFALGCLLLPFIVLMTDVMSHYAWSSIEAREGSSSPNGLHRLYILKTSLPILFLFAGLATLSGLWKNLRVFTTPSLTTMLIWAFPTAVFITWRVLHYGMYWAIRLTNPDLQERRITRDYAIFDQALTIALTAVVVAIIIGLIMSRRKGAA